MGWKSTYPNADVPIYEASVQGFGKLMPRITSVLLCRVTQCAGSAQHPSRLSVNHAENKQTKRRKTGYTYKTFTRKGTGVQSKSIILLLLAGYGLSFPLPAQKAGHHVDQLLKSDQLQFFLGSVENASTLDPAPSARPLSQAPGS